MTNFWKGTKVRLRAVEMSDLENYFCNGEPDTDGQRNGDRMLFPVSKELMRERVAKLAKSNPQGEDFFLIIEDNEGNPVGNINSHSCSPKDGTFEYGIGIKKDHRGKGYAGEAIRILLNYYFTELDYQKVNVKIYSFNEESIKLHEKLGFTLEGRLRRSFFAMGTHHDILCYGLTKEEFSK